MAVGLCGKERKEKKRGEESQLFISMIIDGCWNFELI